MVRPDRPDRHRPRRLAAGVIATLASALVAATPAAAATAPSPRVNLRVLVVTGGDPGSLAVEAELDREGVPYTELDVRTTGRPTITASYLADAASMTGKFQAVVLPSQSGGGLAAAEVSALSAYEAGYGVRQVNAYDFPTTTMGAVSGASGALDGTTATVTAAGKAAPFGYLKGSVPIEDIDPAVQETYGYLAAADPAIKAGETFTPLVTGTIGATTGSILGVYAHGGREELVVTASANSSMQWFDMLAPGIVSWATRGMDLGYHRNYFGVHVDDVFLADSRWSSAGHCTPGDGCTDPTVTTKDVRMTDADVARLVTWQNTSGLKLDMVFNGGGSEAAETANNGTDPLTEAFLANKSQFPWISHTFTHPFLGCIQVSPTTAGATWHCKTSAAPAEVAFDPSVPQSLGPDGVYYASAAFVRQQLQDNISWATTNALPGFDPTELVSGEHSGLATLPQQVSDNPFFVSALGGLGVKWTASDASREPDTRAISATTSTVPRHPMNIFYNAGTFQDEVSEYNWIYAPNTGTGSKGNCTSSAVTTCMASALADSDNTVAKTSFQTYIVPIEVRNALRFVLTNDPRPFYAHQTNLAEDGILYPVLDGIVSSYNGAFDTATTPLVRTTMTEEGNLLTQMNAWKAATKAAGFADGYVDATGVHLPATSVKVPVTVPAGSTGTGLSAYAGSLSGWPTGGATVVPPTTAGGYLVPTAPSGVTATATANNGTATVTWTPGVARVAPVTTWTVTAYAGTTVAATVTSTGATPASLVVPLPFGSYTFDVRASNAVGTGPASAQTSPALAVTGPPTVPTAVSATAGDGTATVTWTASTADPKHPVTDYEVQTIGGATPVATVPTKDGATTTATVTGLANGTSYTFTVVAANDLGKSAASAPSNAVTPAATPAPSPSPAPGGGGGGGGGVPAPPAPPAPVAPGAPALGVVSAGNGEIDLTWTAPAQDGGSAVTGYVVTVYAGTGSTVVTTVTATGTSAAVTGLVNGTGYTVEAAAVNVAGTGAASARSAVVTPSTVPGKVPGVTVKRGAASLAVRWTKPADGGSAITGYVVSAYVGKGVKAVRTVPAKGLATTVTGLKNGTGYTVDVRAVNATGTGLASARSAVVIPATTPGRPTITGTKAGRAGGRSTALLGWKAPSTDGGAAVMAYRITATRYSASGRVLGRTVVTIRSGKVRAAELRLAAGVYRFTVQAVNALGAGSASGPSRPTAAR